MQRDLTEEQISRIARGILYAAMGIVLTTEMVDELSQQLAESISDCGKMVTKETEE